MQKIKEFTYQKLTPEEQKERGILGRLVGTIADFKNPTRNGRLYTESLWDQVFNDPITKEKIETKTVMGELGHPKDREEIDMEKVAISLAEVPKKCTDGTVKGVFDILDTPNGRILKTLCDYGCKIGVSSRGTGDVMEDWNGNQTVDPKSYQFECFDAVLLPSVKAARPSYVNESLNRDNSLKTALTESLNKATPEDKKVMEETLKQLNIDYIDNQLNEEVNTHLKSVDNKVSNTAADDVGADVVKSLQESLKQTKVLQSKVKDLQEKLSVCNAKEVRLAESLQKSNIASQKLQNDLDVANDTIERLEDQLKEKNELIESYLKQIRHFSRLSKIEENKQSQLNESLETNKSEIKRLNEELEQEKEKSKKQLNSLKENLEEVKQNSIIREKELNTKLTRAKALNEHLQKVTNTAVNKYIESKAKLTGIRVEDVKKRLGENYSFNDIDRICEDLSNTQLDISTLPFNINKIKNSNIKVSIKESQEPIKPKSRYDDDIDDQLWYLANKN